MKWKIKKRTFEAKKYPKGSEQRKELNRNAETSEYMPSEKFIVVNKETGFYETYKSLKLAKLSLNYR